MIVLKAKHKELIDLSKGFSKTKNGIKIPIFSIHLNTGYISVDLHSEVKTPLAEIIFAEKLVEELTTRIFKKIYGTRSDLALKDRETIKYELSKMNVSIVFE